VHRYEKRYRRKDGRIVWVSATGTLVHDAFGQPWFFTLMLEDITGRKRAEAALRRLSERLRRLQDEERSRLARELHDSTAQILAALSLNLGVVEGSTEQLSPPAQRALREAISLANQSAREIRTLAYLLHPPELEALGLGSALAAYVEGFAQRSGMRVDLDLPRTLDGLSRELELNIFRIVQEGLANIQRYSGGKSARIRLARRRERLILEVMERGGTRRAGGARAKSATAAAHISGMRERARQVGGALEVLSRTTGATVKVTLPLTSQKAGKRG
jgi:signal transduction histidine kinase